jgi:hypothetical protein
MENIYTYFASFKRAVRKAGWPQERIDAVLDEARRGNYAHALAVLLEAMDEIKNEAAVSHCPKLVRSNDEC